MGTPFKMKGSPMARNFGISPMKETDAEFEARMAKEGSPVLPTVKVPQYSRSESKVGQRLYQNVRTPQSATWGSLSSDEKKKEITKGQAHTKKRAAYADKNRTHKIVKGEWVPR